MLQDLRPYIELTYWEYGPTHLLGEVLLTGMRYRVRLANVKCTYANGTGL